MRQTNLADEGPQTLGVRTPLLAWLFALLLGLPSARAQDPAVVGQWDSLIFLPAVPVHSIVLYTNKIMLFRGDGHDDINHDPTSYVLDLETFQVSSQDPLGQNVFCIGHSQLPDGRILMTGGTIAGTSTGPNYAHVFDPVTELWTPAPDMRDGRYYPTNTPLADGTTLIFSGTNQNDVRNPEVERYIPGAGQNDIGVMEYLENADKAHSEYPRNHLLPDGQVFVAGTAQDTWMLDPVTQVWTEVGDSNFGKRNHGTSVMLPPTHTKIMILGGYDSGGPVEATETCEVIDLSDASPAWTYAAPMHHKRAFHNVVILPDGQVLVAGGSTDPGEEFPVYVSEIYDPATDTWTEVAVQNSYRLYHSSANLLPDGRVIWGGGNGNETIEIYSPPYLFQGPRPTLTNTPASVGYGEVFVVETPDAATIATAVFMRPGAATHSVNMEQRYVGLDFVQAPGEGGVLHVTAPSDGDVAPPGYYMLFLLDGNGVPSEASFVQLGGQVALQVSAGPDQTFTMPDVISLDGTVVSNDPVTTLWAEVSGPGVVTFGDATAVDTTAEFSQSGTYVLSLTADDGSTIVSDTVVVVANEPGTLMAIDEHIVAFFDDAEERDGGDMVLASSDLELVTDSGVQTVGLRFNTIVIPQGATIVSASIAFTVDEVDSGPADLTIEGHDVDIAPPFVDSVDFDISSRARTSASVNWLPGPWTAIGSLQSTPDLSPILQEIVDRPGWTAGNSMAFVFTGTGTRTAEAVDGDPQGSAHLHVLYTNVAPNVPPAVFAGHNQVLTLPALAQLDGTVDDEEPTALFTTWSKVAGPGVVTFGDANDVDTTAGFSLPGSYILQLTVDDGEYAPFDQLMVIVNSPVPNQPPTTSAGLDLRAGLRADVSLAGEVVDDDPTSLSITWSRVSGPRRVDFADAHDPTTTARFHAPGTYVLRLTASDRQFTAQDEITVTIEAAPPAHAPATGAHP